MLKKIGLIGVVILLMMATAGYAQTKKEKKMAGYVIGNYEVECMGTGMDGTQLIKVWGYGNKP